MAETQLTWKDLSAKAKRELEFQHGIMCDATWNKIKFKYLSCVREIGGYMYNDEGKITSPYRIAMSDFFSTWCDCIWADMVTGQKAMVIESDQYTQNELDLLCVQFFYKHGIATPLGMVDQVCERFTKIIHVSKTFTVDSLSKVFFTYFQRRIAQGNSTEDLMSGLDKVIVEYMPQAILPASFRSHPV